MSVKLVFGPLFTNAAKHICVDYWSYDDNEDYLQHVEAVCQKHNISSGVLFELISLCYACIDDVRCESCRVYCHIEVPADIPKWQSQSSWICGPCVNSS